MWRRPRKSRLLFFGSRRPHCFLFVLLHQAALHPEKGVAAHTQRPGRRSGRGRVGCRKGRTRRSARTSHRRKRWSPRRRGISPGSVPQRRDAGRRPSWVRLPHRQRGGIGRPEEDPKSAGLLPRMALPTPMESHRRGVHQIPSRREHAQKEQVTGRLLFLFSFHF